MSELLNYHKKLIHLQIPDIPVSLHNHWVWNLDLREEVSARQMLNEAHLTGLILCRTAGLRRGIIEGSPADTLKQQAVLLTKYNEMSMRTLHDSVEHCQMHMQLLLDGNVQFEEHLNRLFARLGQLLLPMNLPDTMFDVKDDLDVGINGTHDENHVKQCYTLVFESVCHFISSLCNAFVSQRSCSYRTALTTGKFPHRGFER
jgi:hypothetical protein